MKKKVLNFLTTISLALVLFVLPSFLTTLNSKTTQETEPLTRTVSVQDASLDLENAFESFDNHQMETNGTLTTFEGNQTIKLRDLKELENVNDLNLDEDEEVTIKYIFSYDSESNVVTLTAILNNDTENPLMDSIHGVGFINDAGEIDAVMNVDGEGILLSEMRNAGMIQNCGWLSNLFKKIVKAVAVVAAVVAVAAVVVATAGAAAPAVVAAGVGVVAGTASTIASTCLTVAMVAAGISLAAIAVTTIDFEGIKYELKEYAKVAKELLKGFYYLAVGDSEGRMLVSPVRLPTVAAAAAAMNAGLSVYSPDALEAYAAAQLAGGGLAPVLDPAHQNGYFAHYHVCGRPKPASHAFYGVPTTKGSYL